MPECTYGNGSSFTHSEGWSAGIAVVREIAGLTTSRVVSDVTPLSAVAGTYRKKKVSKLIDHEAVEITVYFDSEKGLPTTDAGQATVTYPD